MTARKAIGLVVVAASAAFMPFLGAHRSAGDSQQAASKYQVTIQDFRFQPASLNVPVGATVAWMNKDEEPHTVYSNDNVFKSKALDTDEAFSFTFKKAGTYSYFCSVHPKMVATVVVTSAAK